MLQGRGLGTTTLLVGILGLGWVTAALADSPTAIAGSWPASALAVGLYLGATSHRRGLLLLLASGLELIAQLAAGRPLELAAGFTGSCLVESIVVSWLLLRGRADRQAALLVDQGDLSRFVGAVLVGSGAAAAGYAVSDANLGGQGSPWLVALGVVATHAAGLTVLLPLFMRTPNFDPLAGNSERVVQWVLTLGTTLLVFGSSSEPLIAFAVMPMFAWLTYRGTLREGTILLALVGAIGTILTAAGIGPVAGLQVRYGLAPETSSAILSLFLIDCALIMLPLSITVTHQRKASARAAAERETLERLVASATGTAIIATDQAGRITLFNPGAEAMLGYRAAEVVGALPERFHTPREIARHAAELGCRETFGEVVLAIVHSAERRRLWKFVRADGQERTGLMTMTSVLGERGQVIGYLATAEDITDREEVQAALVNALAHQREAVARLQQLDRVKSDFVSTVSHELRTPITSIVGYTELLEDGAVGELAPAQLDLISRVDRNGRRLLVLIEDLLTLSQVESTGLTLVPTTTDLRLSVTGAREALDAGLASRQLTVEVSVPDEPVLHHGDPHHLERMVLNLLSNAVKFTPDHGRVEVSLRVEPGSSTIEVRDTGLGIPEDEQGQLFRRFFRSSTATHHAIQGTGLGLSIVHAIATSHGGDVNVHSARNQGTTVTVTLPRSRSSCRPVGTSPPAADLVSPASATAESPMSDPALVAPVDAGDPSEAPTPEPSPAPIAEPVSGRLVEGSLHG